MPLAAGTTFGPYQVLAPLGAGGMGEVYRARDTRLNREVALKILNESTAGNADRRARFEREAHAVAALNHPNIVSIYDVGTEVGVFFIVSELVEGESLRERIERGHISVRELLKIAVQMADGIAAAHSAGFVHRDLKPENIMLTADGRVKILDFGLARQTLAAATAPEHTVTMNQTVPGTILGTVNYMSPEQARGLEAGYPSDQFSFGVILYELATGRRAFQRDTTPQTLTAILVEEPAPIEAKLPAPLRWTIDRCLSKDPKARYDSTRDLYQDLRNQQEHFSDLFTASVEAAPAAPQTRTRRNWLYLTIPAACLASVAATLWLTPKHHGIENYRYTPIEISQERPAYATWAPDGKAFAYSADVDGKRQVFIRYADSSAAAQITHEPDGSNPWGWSPDGKRVIVTGKNPKAETPPLALFSLSVTGGEPEFVVPIDWYQGSLSTNGKVLTVIRGESDGVISVAISSPIDAPLKRYSPAPFETRQTENTPGLALSPDGSRILYFLNSHSHEQAWSLPFPAGSGSPKQILQDLPHYGSTPTFSWFPDSLHVVITLEQHQGDAYHLWIADTVTGSRAPLTTGLSDESSPAVSPNGKQILFRETTNEYKLVSASLEDASIRTLISSQRAVGMPAWARKSNKFAYVTNRSGEPEIWLHDADGSERPLITSALFPAGSTNWWMNPTLSPAGDRVAYVQSTVVDCPIWISSLAGGPPVRLTNTSETQYVASWSPDGARIAYLGVKGGGVSLMISKTNGQATPVELRSKLDDVSLPDWSPTGEWLSFHDDAGWYLISPDGKTTRALGKIATPHLTFSKDGQTLYGIRAERNHQYLFSIGLDGKQMKTIGDVGSEFVPDTYLGPGLRFSLSPDGKSILYPSYTTKTSLWMLDGFDAP